MMDNKILLQEYKNNINKLMNNIVNDVILFGSQNNEEATSFSDYDLLIITNETLNWELKNNLEEICYKIDLQYNIISDTHVLSKAELLTLKGKQSVYTNAIKNGLYA